PNPRGLDRRPARAAGAFSSAPVSPRQWSDISACLDTRVLSVGVPASGPPPMCQTVARQTPRRNAIWDADVSVDSTGGVEALPGQPTRLIGSEEHHARHDLLGP